MDPLAAGAYLLAPTARAWRSSASSAKYLRGMTTPQSETESKFGPAICVCGVELRLLVVVFFFAPPARQYKGTGTINDAGSYGFLMSAVDGDALGGNALYRLRMKIWDRASGQLGLRHPARPPPHECRRDGARCGSDRGPAGGRRGGPGDRP